MLFFIISLILGVATSGLTTYFCGLYNGIEDIYIPILLTLAFFVAWSAAQFIITLIMTLFINTKKPIKKPSKFWLGMYNYMDAFVLTVARLKIVTTGNEKLGDGPYQFVFNHRSNFDPMIASKVYKKYKPLMISKETNFKIPLAGPVIHKAGFLCLHREDNREGLKVILKAADYLKQGEYSIGIFPEGTRNQHKRNLLPFKNGCFKIAMRANVPIAVVCINGTEKITSRSPLKRTVINVDLIKVITPDEYQGMHTNEVGNMVKELMLDCINSYEPLAKEDMVIEEIHQV